MYCTICSIISFELVPNYPTSPSFYTFTLICFPTQTSMQEMGIRSKLFPLTAITLPWPYKPLGSIVQPQKLPATVAHPAISSKFWQLSHLRAQKYALFCLECSSSDIHLPNPSSNHSCPQKALLQSCSVYLLCPSVILSTASHSFPPGHSIANYAYGCFLV